MISLFLERTLRVVLFRCWRLPSKTKRLQVRSICFARGLLFDTHSWLFLRAGVWRRLGTSHREALLVSILGRLLILHRERGDGFLLRWFGFELQTFRRFLLRLGDQGRKSSRTRTRLKYLLLSRRGSRLLLLALRRTYKTEGVWYPRNQLFLFLALRFKLGLRPFHSWNLRILTNTSYRTAGFLATVRKFARFDRLVAFQFSREIQFFVIGRSLFIGSVGAVGERFLPRLFAYSGLRHGRMILLSPTPQARRCYRLVYILTSSLAWAFLKHYPYTGKIVYLNAIQRKTRITLVIFSLAGVPPFIGFWRKAYVFQHLVSRVDGSLSVTSWILRGIVRRANGVRMVYSLTIRRSLWFEERRYQVSPLSSMEAASQVIRPLSSNPQDRRMSICFRASGPFVFALW